MVLVPYGVYYLSARLVPKSNVELRTTGQRRALLDFTGVLGVSSGEFALIYNTGISNFKMDGFEIQGDVTEFTNNGFETYCVRFDSSTNCGVQNTLVKNAENGIIFKGGCSDCSAIDVESIDCFNQGIGSIATSSDINQRMTFQKVRCHATGTTFSLAPLSGFRFEETYDSNVDNVIAYNCSQGVRIENS